MRPLLLALFSIALSAAPLSAATFTVTTSGVSGPGTLEQAILDANATPGRDQIVFTVADVGTDTTLPAITDPVDIDGSVGSGLARVGPFATCDGCTLFRFSAGSSGSTIRDLLLIEFSNHQIIVDAGVTGIAVTNIVFTARIRISGNDAILQSLTSRGPAYLDMFGTGNQVVGSSLTNTAILAFGSNTIIRDNTISGQTGNAAILVLAPAGVDITGNTIVAALLPIDLGANGRTANDPAPDADTGANAQQNFPVLTAAY